jgi:hypothetical protein
MAEQDSNTPPAAPTPKSKQHSAPDAAGNASPLHHAKAIGAHKERQLKRGDVVVTSVNGQAVDMSVFSWQHNAAAALHGWAEHEHHEAKPVNISLDDYKKALLAASAPVVRAAVEVKTEITVKREKEDPRKVAVVAAKGDVLDLRKLGITTEDLAMAGVSFTADYEPHAPAMSKHAAHAKNAEAAKQADPKPDDDSHLFAKA